MAILAVGEGSSRGFAGSIPYLIDAVLTGWIQRVIKAVSLQGHTTGAAVYRLVVGPKSPVRLASSLAIQVISRASPWGSTIGWRNATPS